MSARVRRATGVAVLSLATALAQTAPLTLNGCCGYFLLRRLRIGFWPALCGGLVIEMLPFVADQIGVLQSTVLFPIPMTLACLVGFGRTGSAWSALGGVLWMAVCYHTSANTALFFGPAALLALLVFGGRRLLDARSALVLAVVGLVG